MKALNFVKTLVLAAVSFGLALGALSAHAADKRIVVTGENSSADNPYVLTKGKTYTADEFDRDPPGSWCNIGGAAVAVTNIMSGAEVTKIAYLVGTNITFSGNKTTKLSGGALYTKGCVTLSDTIFINNTAAAQGGAFFAWTGSVTLDNGAAFVGNKQEHALGAGGAVLNWHAAVNMNGSMLFKDNAAVGTGGGIANQWLSDLTINGDATFTNNTAVGKGGAIDNAGSKLSFTGTIDLQTDTDTWINRMNHEAPATVNWDLTQVTDSAQSKVCIKGFQRFGNEYRNGAVQSSQTLTVKADGEQPEGRYVIATGDFSRESMAATNVTEFIVTNGTASVTITPDGGVGVIGMQGYELAVEESEEEGADQLVLKITQYTCTRKVITTDPNPEKPEEIPSPCVLEEGKTYTAAPYNGRGGAVYVDAGGTVTGTNVTFAGNTATSGGGAIYNDGGMVNMANTVTLATETDTIYNNGTLNWDLTGEATGKLVNYQYLTNDRAIKITIDDTLVAPADLVIATGDFSDVAGKDSFTLTNATSGASATIAIDGEVIMLGSTYWRLATEAAGETTNLVLKALKPTQLMNVVIAGTTAVVTMDGSEITPVEGAYTVLSGEPLTITYTVDEDYMFEAGLKTKTVTFEGLESDYAMTDADKASVTAALAATWTDEREITVDTRARIVIGDPSEVLPIGYSTNFWGEAEDGDSVALNAEYEPESGDFTRIAHAKVNGYASWQPRDGVYGVYRIRHTVVEEIFSLDEKEAMIYYSAPYTLTIAESEGGTIAVTDSDAAVASGDSVLGYELLNLTATPVPLTNDARYEFAGWDITTNGAAVAGATALPAVTEFEMPNADTVLAANFQWKSTFTETVTVEADYTWEALDDDDYQGGLYNDGTVVWKPGQTNAQGRAYGLKHISQLHNGSGGKLQIVFDETLTNATYKLGTDYQAIGMTFEITDGVNAGNCTAVWEDDYATADWTYVGAKRFKLWVEGDHSDLLLVVEDGTPHTLTLTQPEGGTITAATNGTAVASGEQVLPAMTVSLAATPAANWQFEAWNVITNGVPFGGLVEAALETTFEMPEADVTVTANFIVSLTYKAETTLAITNAAADAIAAVNAMNLSAAEKASHIDQIKADRDAQVAAAAGASVPAGVSGALDAANAAFDATLTTAQAEADRTWTVTPVCDPVKGGTVTVTNASEARLTVEVRATPAENWQFNGWTGTYGDEATAIEFDDAAALKTTFTMPEAEVTVTAAFGIAETYRTELLGAATASYETATNTLAALRMNRLTDDETDAALAKALGAFNLSVDALNAATKPAEGETATTTLDTTLATLAADAAETSDAKPYTITIDPTAEADGTNVFNTLNELLAAKSLVPFLTNLVVNGTVELRNEPELDVKVFENLAAITGTGRILVDAAIENADAIAEAFAMFVAPDAAVDAIAAETALMLTDATPAGEVVGIDSITLAGTTTIGTNVVFTAPAVTNNGTLAWNLTGGNHAAALANLDAIAEGTGAAYAITVDAEPENGAYTLATEAETAKGKTFTVKGYNTGDFTIAVGGTVAYPGAKAFTLAVNAANELVLTVSDGRFAIAATTVNVGGAEGDAAGGTVTVASEAIVGTAVEITATPAENWQFNGWTGNYGDDATALAFADAAAPATTFEMPIGEVTLTATFALDETYRTASLAAVSDALAATVAAIGALPLNAAELEAALEEAEANAKAATDAINAAVRPETVAAALADAAAANKRLVVEADDAAEGEARFDVPEMTVTEGDTFTVPVFGGATDVNTAITVKYTRDSYRRTVKAYLDGQRVSFPLQLTWVAGDRAPKMLTLVLAKATRGVETDNSFTLQLGSPVANEVGTPSVCTITVRDQEGGSPETPYACALAWPMNGGQVTGSGMLIRAKSTRTLRARANKWATFAGWYAAKADDPESPDLENGFLTAEKKIKVTQAEAGTYYAVFTDVMPVIAVVDPGDQVIEKGVYVEIPLNYVADPADTKAKVSVSGLPAGLKFNRKKGLIYGTPKRVQTRTVTVKGTGTAGKHTFTFAIEVTK